MFNDADSTITRIGGVASLSAGIQRILISYLAERYGPKKCLGILIPIICILTCTLGFASTILLYAIWIVAIITCVGDCTVLFASLILQTYGVSKSTQIYGLIGTSYIIIYLLVFIINNYLLQIIGYTGIFIAMGLFTLLSLKLCRQIPEKSK